MIVLEFQLSASEAQTIQPSTATLLRKWNNTLLHVPLLIILKQCVILLKRLAFSKPTLTLTVVLEPRTILEEQILEDFLPLLASSGLGEICKISKMPSAQS